MLPSWWSSETFIHTSCTDTYMVLFPKEIPMLDPMIPRIYMDLLGGDFKYFFLFSPLFVEDSHFWLYNIFQRGWFNHQLDLLFVNWIFVLFLFSPQILVWVQVIGVEFVHGKIESRRWELLWKCQELVEIEGWSGWFILLGHSFIFWGVPVYHSPQVIIRFTELLSIRSLFVFKELYPWLVAISHVQQCSLLETMWNFLCIGTLIPKYVANQYLAILCDLFGMVTWPFSMVKWPPTRGWKGHFESPGKYYQIFRV